MKKTLIAAALCATAPFAAQAELRINGFANFVGGMTSSDDQVYGYDDRFSFSEDSLFAIQLSGDVNDKITATGQIVARGVDDYSPEFAWAYLTYAASDQLSISAGRLRLPVFKYSESLEVGYSYHWIAPPRNVYAVAFNNLEGLRIDYSNYAGDWEYNLQLAGGVFREDIAGGSAVGENTLVATAELQREWFKIRGVLGRTTARFSSPGIDQVVAGIAQVDPVLANLVAFNDDSGRFIGVSTEIDTFDYFFIAEYTENRNDDTFIPVEEDFYISAGMRRGKWTPSVTYEDSKQVEGPKFSDRVAALPAPLQVPVSGGIALLQGGFTNDFDVTTLGVSYNYATNIALKGDVSKYDDRIDDTRDGTLVRVAVNYIF